MARPFIELTEAEKILLVCNTSVLVEKILRNLPAFDLCRCACVSKLWNSMSMAELYRRRKPVSFYQEHSDRRQPASYRSSAKHAGMFEDEFDRKIKNLEIKPGFCIAFATCTLYENFEKFFPSHPIYEPKRMRFDGGDPRQRHFETIINTALKKRLPTNCQVCLYVGISIIGTHRGSKKVRKTCAPAMSGYFFPELPQPGIHFCRLNDCEEFKTIVTTKNLKNALILMNYNIIEYYTLKLKEIWSKLTENSIVFPVTIGSDVIPLFFGSNVKTVCLELPSDANQSIQIQHFGEETEVFDLPLEDENNGQVLQQLNNQDIQILQQPDAQAIQVFQGPFYEIQNDQIIQELDKRDCLRRGTVAFMFGIKYLSSFFTFCEEFNRNYPSIPIVGLFGTAYEYKVESNSENCNCLLISFNYNEA